MLEATGFEIKWSDFIGEHYDNNKNICEISVRHLYGTSRDVADRARTTIGLEEGTKEVPPTYMKRMYLCEHSPIRTQQYLVRIKNVPYSIAMHLVRHNQGIEKWVSTNRDDRVNIESQSTRDRDLLPCDLELQLNPQSLINISRKRLCRCAHVNTQMVWCLVTSAVRQINKPLAECMVRECVYRGFCPEFKKCSFYGSKSYEGQRKLLIEVKEEC